MPPPTWNPGQVLASADVDAWFVPLVAVKTADQSRTSSTTLVNDSELVVAVAASATYRFECYLDYEGGTENASDLKWGWTVPSGAGLRYHALREGPGGFANSVETERGTDVVTAGTKGAGNLCGASMLGTLLTAGSGGNVQLQWAQNTSSGTPTIVHAQSCIILWRIS